MMLTSCTFSSYTLHCTVLILYYFTGGDKAKSVEFRARLREIAEMITMMDITVISSIWNIALCNNGISPNFYPDDKAPNKAIIELYYDYEKLNAFVELCAEKIKAFLKFSPESI